MLRTLAIGVLAACWGLWILALAIRAIRGTEREHIRRPVSYSGGILLILVGLACLFSRVFPGDSTNPALLLILSMLVGPASVLLAVSATRYLTGLRQLEVALLVGGNSNISGPYRWLRCPMYASILGMALATALAYSSLLMTVLGMPLILIGIEIGVYAEDRQLADRFQDLFIEYSSNVKAYIPFFR